MTEKLTFQLTLYPTPVLRKVAQPVEDFDEELAAFVGAMYERMYESAGVGLAAPQVGSRQRILVINITGKADEGEELTLINAEILERTGPKSFYEEGCLSFPGIYADVERPERCRVAFQDVEGNQHEQEFDGFTSRVVQHEYDHLEGVLLVDRMSTADKLRNKGALEELVETYRAANGTPKRRRRR